jgi:acetyl esterase
LEPEEARRQPSPADALAKLLQERGTSADELKKLSGVVTKDITYNNKAGDPIPARVYTPAGAQGNLPVILYIHGGGWVIANLDTYDASPRALAKKANAIVVSVHYRQAPEHKFPAAHDDVVAAYKMVVENAGQWGGDTRRVAIVGESAGGNMAMDTAIAARDRKWQQPVHVVAVYPVAGVDLNTQSYQDNEKAKPLSKAGIEWFVKHLTKSPEDLQDSRLDIIGKADLKGLPPVTIINAEIDPLLTDGERLAKKLQQANVPVKQQTYKGVVHEFFGMDAVVSEAAAAQDLAVQELQRSFGAEPATGSTSTAD